MTLYFSKQQKTDIPAFRGVYFFFFIKCVLKLVFCVLQKTSYYVKL
ncbi:hypothetical protein FM106_32085 [Brachybacterium faecium]|nr:hypothetical protein FM106_32085 [Brachybacterium faecium]